MTSPSHIPVRPSGIPLRLHKRCCIPQTTPPPGGGEVEGPGSPTLPESTGSHSGASATCPGPPTPSVTWDQSHQLGDWGRFLGLGGVDGPATLHTVASGSLWPPPKGEGESGDGANLPRAPPSCSWRSRSQSRRPGEPPVGDAMSRLVQRPLAAPLAEAGGRVCACARATELEAPGLGAPLACQTSFTGFHWGPLSTP